jgi:hypothetical protein
MGVLRGEYGCGYGSETEIVVSTLVKVCSAVVCMQSCNHHPAMKILFIANQNEHEKCIAWRKMCRKDNDNKFCSTINCFSVDEVCPKRFLLQVHY